MKKLAFLSQINEPLGPSGNRAGVSLGLVYNNNDLFENWATAQATGKIVIIGEQMEIGFRPIRTFVPENYIEYTCPTNCRDGHTYTRIRLHESQEYCPRCGLGSRRYEVKNGKPISVSETIKT